MWTIFLRSLRAYNKLIAYSSITLYALTGTGEKLHQYASTPSGDFEYDAAGRLSDLTTAGRSYRYDALGRLKELVLAAGGLVPTNSAFLNNSTTTGNWIEENDYITEDSPGAGRLIWNQTPVGLTEIELQFQHDTSGGSVYGPEYYAQVILRATQYGPGTNEFEWRYLAVSLQPDGFYLREWDEDAVDELGGVEIEIPDGQWHDLKVELNDDNVTVKLDLDGGTGVETIAATTSIPSGGNLGLGVGELAGYKFKGMKTDQPVAAAVSLRYHYDTAGRVVGRTLNPDTTPVSQYFIYDDDRIMLELDGSGEVITEWVYGVYIDEIIAMYRNTDGQPGFDETYYYIQDDLFNVVALADDQGNVVERYAYDDYGFPTIYDELGNAETESQYGNIFLFNGRRWDETLELYDYRTRYYDPAMGRFLRIDTIGPWGDNNNLGNAYAYVGNNPWTFNDPYGEWAWDKDWLETAINITTNVGYFTNSGRAARRSFYGVSAGEQLRAMGQGALVVLQGDAPELIWSTTAAVYEQRIMMHYGVNGGDIESAITSASGPLMVGADLVGFTELDEARLGLDFNTGGAIEGQERVQRAFVGSSKFAGSVAFVGASGSSLAQGYKGVGLPRFARAQAVEATATRAGQTGQVASARALFGRWVSVNESMSGRAAFYQARFGRVGQAYRVNGVNFDGVSSGVLLEAKGPGYASFVRNGTFQDWFRGRNALVRQARRQLEAANGTPIQWHFAEESAANATRALFSKRGITGIEIRYTP